MREYIFYMEENIIMLKWTKEDIVYLKDNYKTKGAVGCKVNLPHTFEEIEEMASILGLEYIDTGWTKEDIRILKKYYEKGGYKLCLSKGLLKYESVVEEMATTLGIEHKGELKYKKWLMKDCLILFKYYPKGGAIHCINNGLEKSRIEIDNEARLRGVVLNKDGLDREGEWLSWEKYLCSKYYPIGGSDLCREEGLYRNPSEISSMYLKLLDAMDKRKNDMDFSEDGVRELSIKGLSRANLWSDEEYRILYKYYPLGGTNLCVEKGINRCKGAISKRASDFRIKRLKKGMNHFEGEWSLWEIDVLKKYYPIGGVSLCKEEGIYRLDDDIDVKLIELKLK